MTHVFVSNFEMHYTIGQTTPPDKKVLHTLQSNSTQAERNYTESKKACFAVAQYNNKEMSK